MRKKMGATPSKSSSTLTVVVLIFLEFSSFLVTVSVGNDDERNPSFCLELKKKKRLKKGAKLKENLLFFTRLMPKIKPRCCARIFPSINRIVNLVQITFDSKLTLVLTPSVRKMAVVDHVAHDIQSILSSSARDYLVRNNGDLAKLENLKGKKVGLYFSASWCPPCRRFTPTLVELYGEVSAKDFEIVFVSGDKDEDAFKGYFSKMPWLAIPFSDSDTRKHLNELFKVRGIPHLVILDENGKVITEDGTMVVREYGAEAYPFTPERIKELKDQEEEAKRNQSLRSLLVFKSRDFVISSDGKQVPVSELEGRTLGLYFSSFSYGASIEFTPQLVEFYEKLKTKGEDFEIVLISVGDDDEESFKQGVKGMPWLALPYKDKTCEKLARYFELSTLPTLVIIGPDGKTLHSNVVETIEEHGIASYPFTPEKFAELAEIEKAKEAAQTLESILVSMDLDFVIGKDGIKIPVSDLVGKTVLLYFSAHWCPPCRAFLPKLIEAYHNIQAKGNALEVVFISSDRDQASFNDFFAGMPWLALPFGDSRKSFLSRKFKVQGIPMLVAIAPSGRTVTTDARDIVALYGAEAYPFTEERVKELEAASEEMAKANGWPEKVTHKSHEHELLLSRRKIYYCDGCDEEGHAWSYYCDECDFDLHPKCALGEEKPKESTDEQEGNKQADGWVCDGEVCSKA